MSLSGKPMCHTRWTVLASLCMCGLGVTANVAAQQTGKIASTKTKVGDPITFSDEMNPGKISSKAFQSGNYLAAISALELAAEKYSSPPMDQVFGQTLGAWYAHVGDFKRSRRQFANYGYRPLGAMTSADESEWLRRKALPACDEIVRAAAAKRIVMINEAHHEPRHRAFTTTLLASFYDAGFRYLALESLQYDAIAGITERGYPILRDGGYTDEPLYADLIRTATRIGFKLIPFEALRHEVRTGTNDPFASRNSREEVQAGKLAKVIRDDPNAKMLVHCGYAHIWERSSDSWKHTAEFLKRLTGIDPFTIDQVAMSERASRVTEAKLCRKIVERGGERQPFVLVGEDNGLWAYPADEGAYDVSVIHPLETSVRGRPDWLEMGGYRKAHAIPQSWLAENPATAMIQAFVASEAADIRIPIDQFLVSVKQPARVLMLPPGRYLVRLVDQLGRTLAERTVDVSSDT